MAESKADAAASVTIPAAADASASTAKRDWLRPASVAIVTLTVALLWLVRWAGPIDLRFDAAVYYVLGTSLAQGDGYRIISEPGSPEGVQYPPALPAWVALHQRALGTSDIAVVAPALRKTYAVLTLVYGLAVLALARAYLRPWPALFATLAALWQVNTTLYSDMLFTELPFALVSVALVLTLRTRRFSPQSPWREACAFLLASVGFLLRAAGIALLVAWVGEALLERRWRLAVIRGGLALLPFLAWQAHVRRVQHSDDYAHPAYAYQRAPYMYYNVTYGENLALVDPFRPEAGRTELSTVVKRVAVNLLTLAPGVGEAISQSNGFWRTTFGVYSEAKNADTTLSIRAMNIPLLLLAALAVAGWWSLARRRAWALVVLIPVSIALVCLTPWPQQFGRYLTPLVPFLTIVAALGGTAWCDGLRRGRHAWLRYALYGFGAAALTVQVHALEIIFRERHYEPATFKPGRGIDWPRLFYYDRRWVDWERAMTWVNQQAKRDEIVATNSPHQLYLTTGLQAVMPPMEADRALALRLMETVPVSWLIVDENLDMARTYGEPAVKSDPAHWQLVKQFGTARVYQRGPAIGQAEDHP